MDALKMLIVVTGTDMYADGNLQTGLWLSELTSIIVPKRQGMK